MADNVPRDQSELSSPSADWLSGGGEMARFVQTLDWASTPLGPLAAWPQSLRSALSICLGSRFPIVIYWGPDLVVLYNDAYAEILGKKHPWALGRSCREVWSEIWDVIAPMLDRVLATGDATWSEDQLLFLERRGYPEECYFSFSFSPVRGANGGVDGIFTAVIENTRRVLGERRLRTLRDLGASLAEAKSAEEACRHRRQHPRRQLVPTCRSLCFTSSIRRQDAASWSQAREAPTRLPLPFRSSWTAPTTTRRLGLSRGSAAPARRRRSTAVLVGTRPAAGNGGRASLRRGYGGRRQPASRAGPGVQRLLRTGRAPHRGRHRRRTCLRGRAPARRGAGRDRSRQDRVLLQRQPRVPHAADADARTARGAASASSDVRPRRYRPASISSSSSPTATACGCSSSSIRCSTSRASRRAACRPSYEPTDLAAYHGGARQRVPLRDREGGPRLIVDCPAAFRAGVRRSRDVGEDRPQSPLQRLQVHVRGRDRGQAARRRTTHVELAVRDTGTGIPADELPKLFERFHRVAGAQGRTHEGSGIGLALVQELVKLHGGSVVGRKRARPRQHLHGRHPARPQPPARRADRRGAHAGLDGARGRRRSSRRRCAGCPRPAPDDERIIAGCRRAAARRPNVPASAPASSSPTTTPTCATTCAGCSARATRSRPSPDGEAALAAIARATARPGADRHHDAAPRWLRTARAAARRSAHEHLAGHPAVGAGRRGEPRRGHAGGCRRLPHQAVQRARVAGARRGAREDGPAPQRDRRPCARARRASGTWPTTRRS